MQEKENLNKKKTFTNILRGGKRKQCSYDIRKDTIKKKRIQE